MVSPFRLPPQSEPPLSPRKTLPTMYDLPSELPGEPGLQGRISSFTSRIIAENFFTPQY